ncbi:MAG: hypothetical protein IKE46_03580 [Selenomonadaceae bacterium]|nr:hypothetical protein [Selenomonadaceae bacterium]
MKKFFAIVTTLIICAMTSITFAEEPTCILLKFSNDTRYKNVDSAALLSDLVFEKLLASGKFNFNETKPIDQDMEVLLYDEKMRDINNLQKSIGQGNFNALFESGNFDSKHAQSVATAQVGQIVSPSITAVIGAEHDAQYLIQGTIINLGQGSFSGNVDTTSPGQRGGIYFYRKEAAVGVTVALRIIQAETGEVVWAKDISAQKKTSLNQLGMFMIGTAKISTEMYSKMMDDAATKISDAMIEDLNAGRLFAK